MKTPIFLIALLALVGNIAICQTADQVSAQYTPELKLLDATIICLDAIEAPTKYNKFAKPFINKPTFPKTSPLVSHDDLRKNINNWLKNKPTLIQAIISERKKAHDILYGPRPY